MEENLRRAFVGGSVSFVCGYRGLIPALSECGSLLRLFVNNITRDGTLCGKRVLDSMGSGSCASDCPFIVLSRGCPSDGFLP